MHLSILVVEPYDHIVWLEVAVNPAQVVQSPAQGVGNLASTGS